MPLYFKKAFILTSTLLLTLSFITSCMYVKNLNNKSITSLQEISLNLNRLNNVGGTGSDYFYSVIESDNYYIAVGQSQSNLSGFTGGSTNTGATDFVIAKFNKADLSIVSLNNLGGTGWERFESVIESGSYYIAVGYSDSDLSGFTGGSANITNNEDFVIAKFNKTDLSLVSINNLGGTGSDYFESVIESDLYYIAAGQATSDLSGLTGGNTSAGSYDFVIAKFNKSDLSLVSLNNTGGSSIEKFYSLIESDGYYIATGYSRSNLSGLTGGSTNAGDADFVIAKFNKSNLSLVSINNLGEINSDYFYSVTEAGNYYIAVGYSDSDLSSLTGGNANIGNYDFVIAKFNKSDLSLVTLNNLGGTSWELFESVIESGSYYIAVGYSDSDLSSLTGGSDNIVNNDDFVIAKFNKADLSLVNLNNLGKTGNDYFYSVIESDGHYIAAGYSQSDLSSLTGGSTNTGGPDFVIVKFGD